MTADFVWCGTCPPGVGRTLLCWSKRVWRCRHRACPTVTFSERTVVVRPRGVLTERARAEACRRVGQDAHSVAQVAADLGELGGVPGPTLARSRWMDHRPRAGLSRALTAVGDLTSFRGG